MGAPSCSHRHTVTLVSQVVSALAADPDFLRKLFVALEGANPGSSEWVDLVAFLQVGAVPSGGCDRAVLG